MRLLIKLATNAFALAIVAYLVPEFYFDSVSSLLVAAVVIGIINTLIKPVLQIIALPISIITFGVAAFLINVFLLWFASTLVPGFEIAGFWTAVISSIVLSVVSWFLNRLEKESAEQDNREKKRTH